MSSKGQMTGMLGVYLAAAELTKRDFIVSTTSRSAFGADLLVTDQHCQQAWSVQVKTNRNATSYWLLGAHAAKLKSKSHIYVFVNLKGDMTPEYLVVPSEHVASHVYEETAKPGSKWYSFSKLDRLDQSEGWHVFGSALTVEENSPAEDDQTPHPLEP